MRDTVISALEGLLWLLLMAMVGAGYWLGGTVLGAMINPIFPRFDVLGGIIGGVIGLLTGVIATGVVFVLLDIRDALRSAEGGAEDKSARRSDWVGGLPSAMQGETPGRDQNIICPHCGASNRAKRDVCYQCAKELRA